MDGLCESSIVVLSYKGKWFITICTSNSYLAVVDMLSRIKMGTSPWKEANGVDIQDIETTYVDRGRDMPYLRAKHRLVVKEWESRNYYWLNQSTLIEWKIYYLGTRSGVQVYCRSKRGNKILLGEWSQIDEAKAWVAATFKEVVYPVFKDSTYALKN